MFFFSLSLLCVGLVCICWFVFSHCHGLPVVDHASSSFSAEALTQTVIIMPNVRTIPLCVSECVCEYTSVYLFTAGVDQ